MSPTKSNNSLTNGVRINISQRICLYFVVMSTNKWLRLSFIAIIILVIRMRIFGTSYLEISRKKIPIISRLEYL